MAWNNIGPIFELMPGQSATWTYSFENGQDMGLQLAGPNYPLSVIYPGDLGVIVTSNQGKSLLGITANGGAMVNYQVTVTNLGNEVGSHNLQGGGVS